MGILPLLFVAAASLLSCSAFDNNTAILLTDKPDLAAYVELFNAGQDTYRIELRYNETPALALEEGQSVPDLVLGDGLASGEIISLMAPLDSLFEKELVDQDVFYPELLQHGCIEEKHYLLPVSYNVPAVVYRHTEGGNSATTFSIPLETLHDLSKEFNQEETSGYRAMGFSPRWNPEALYLFACLHGAKFRESAAGYVQWNEQNLLESVAYAREWTKQVNGGIDREQAFTDKYMYEPGYELVQGGRIRFYLTTIREFFVIPSDTRDELTFSWLSGEAGIPTCDSIVYIGVLRESRNKKPAQAFLSWFFRRETQRQLLDSIQYKRIRTFGIAEGFSSIPSVNELIFPGYYPVLAGHIPPAESLDFSPVTPPDWQKAKKEAIIPWLRDAVNGSAEPLTERIRKWLRTAR